MSEPVVPPPPPAPPAAPTGDSSNRTLMLVLAYLFPLSLIPLLTEKEDKEVQWHAKHGIVIGIAFAILWTLYVISLNIPFLGCFTLFLFPIIALAGLIVAVVAIMKATQGKRFLIPWLSDFADKF
jgi:uncharacterized membrane protein